MELIKDFVNYLIAETEAHDCYLWGGQGEKVTSTSIAKIASMETTKGNAGRVIAHVGNNYKSGYDMSKAKFFDCSGLGTYYFVKHKLIKSDTTAHGLYKMCKAVKRDDLRAGDFVFKVSNGQATHIGYMIDGNTCVEMYGRDVGILKTKLGSGSNFNTYGRPQFNWV